MNMVLAPVTVVLLCGASLAPALLGSVAGGALLEAVVRRRLQPRPLTRRG